MTHDSGVASKWLLFATASSQKEGVLASASVEMGNADDFFHTLAGFHQMQ